MLAQKKSVLLATLALGAIFFPTTFSGTITSKYTILFSLCLLALFIGIILRYNFSISVRSLVFSFSIILSLLYYTMIAPSNNRSLGAIIYYVSFALIITVDFFKEEFDGKVLIKFFRFLSLTVVVIGLFMVFDLFNMNSLVIKYYSAYYADLLPLMIYGRKPVITFATQSVAGFALFLFLFLIQKTWGISKRNFDLIIVACLYFLLYSLKSFTSISFIIIGLVLLFVQSNSNQRKAIIFLFSGIIIYLLTFESNQFALVMDTFNFVFNKQNNGLLGRYSTNGALINNINYIKSINFRPIGFSYRSDLSYVDSGYIEYFLRGGIPLITGMIVGFLYFVFRNIKNKIDSISLCGSFLLFELGFSGLTHPRILFFLPFVVCYLQVLSKEQCKDVIN